MTTKRIALAAGVLGIVWALAVFVLVPAVIRGAYAGDSLAWLNRIIRGQAGNPVDHYLEIWRSVAAGLTLGLALLAGLTLAVFPFRRRLAARTRSIAMAMPAAGPVGLFLLAVWTGCIGGLVEAATVEVRHLLLHLPTGAVTSAEVVWYGPLVATLTLVSIGLAGLALDRASGARGAVIGVLPALFVALAAFSAIDRMAIGIHPAANALLSTGIGVQVARAMTRAMKFRALIRRSALVLAPSILAFALVVTLGRRIEVAGAFRDHPEPPPGAPNVLIIVWDAARAASLSTYGYDRETTPELTKLAAEGILFERAIAPASWTLPTHASLFTGLYPHRLSVGWLDPLDDERPTLAEVLAARGFATGGFVANPFYTVSGYGLERGFDTYDDHASRDMVAALSTWRLADLTLRRVLMPLDDGRDGARRTAADIVRAFLQWPGRTARRPYFAFLNLYDAHHPYIAPRPWDRIFTDRRLRQTYDDDRFSYTPAELAELRTSYESCIRYMDWELGRLLDALRSDGSLDNTLIILTSDHGEQFGERDPALIRHGRSLDLPVLHVPLVIRYPPLGTGLRRPEPVSLRDLAATILDVIGSDPWPLPGRPLLGPVDEAEPVAVFATIEQYIRASDWPDWPASAGAMHSVVSGNLQYIRDARGDEFLFDIETDYWERRNLVHDAAQAAEVERLRSAVDDFLALAARDGAVRDRS